MGYGEGGQLTDAVRRRPSSVVVLDEIEKAHRDVQMLLLQVLEEGRLTDGRGRQVDFSNTVVVLTSNLGAAEVDADLRAAPWASAPRDRAAPREDRALGAARAAVPPELWNRLDERLVLLARSRARTWRGWRGCCSRSPRGGSRPSGGSASRPTTRRWTYLLEHGGWDPSLGARPMRGAIQRLVEAPLAERILAGEFAQGDAVRVTAGEEGLTFVSAPAARA